MDAGAALARLDALGRELAEAAADGDGSPAAEAEACRVVLGGVHGFAGQRAGYDDPVNSMLDRVLVRRRGLPILLSVVYVEVARRAAIPLRGVGLPGHFVVGHFGGGGPVPDPPARPLRGRPRRRRPGPARPHTALGRARDRAADAQQRRRVLRAARRSRRGAPRRDHAAGPARRALGARDARGGAARAARPAERTSRPSSGVPRRRLLSASTTRTRRGARYRSEWYQWPMWAMTGVMPRSSAGRRRTCARRRRPRGPETPRGPSRPIRSEGPSRVLRDVASLG